MHIMKDSLKQILPYFRSTITYILKKNISEYDQILSYSSMSVFVVHSYIVLKISAFGRVLKKQILQGFLNCERIHTDLP